MPYIKPNLDGDTGPSIDLGHDDSPVVTDLGNGLLVTYVIDEGTTFKYVQNRHLFAGAINEDVLRSAALQNFAAFITDRIKLHSHNGLFALILDGNFEASLLLVDDLWDEYLAQYAPNGFIAAVPARDILAFADAESEAGIQELRNLLSRIGPGSDHLIASDLYRRQSGMWKKYSEGASA